MEYYIVDLERCPRYILSENSKLYYGYDLVSFGLKCVRTQTENFWQSIEVKGIGIETEEGASVDFTFYFVTFYPI